MKNKRLPFAHYINDNIVSTYPPCYNKGDPYILQ